MTPFDDDLIFSILAAFFLAIILGFFIGDHVRKLVEKWISKVMW